MATPIDPKQVVSFEEVLMSQVVRQEAPPDYLLREEYSPKRSFGRW
jgi:hypothetical protein